MEHRDNPEDSVTNQQLKTDEILEDLVNTIKEGIMTKPIPYRSTLAFGDVNSTGVVSLEFVLAFEIKNPYKNTAIIKEIDLVPDANMQTNGAVQIFVNKVKVYDSSTHGFFKFIGTDNVLFESGIRIERDESVQVFLKTNDISIAIELAVRVLFINNAGS